MTWLLRGPIGFYRRLAFKGWSTVLRLRLARFGMRLELDAPDGAVLRGFPRLEVEGADRGGRVGLRIGRAVRIGAGVELQVHAAADNALDIGDGCRVASGARFKLVGGSIRIGERSVIRDFVVLKSAGRLEIGRRNTISYGVVVHCTDAITFEDGVGLAEGTTVIDSEHVAGGSDLPWYELPVASEPVLLARNTFVLANSAVLKGTVTGEGCVAGAGSVLRGRYPDRALLVGAPARVARRLASGSA